MSQKEFEKNADLQERESKSDEENTPERISKLNSALFEDGRPRSFITKEDGWYLGITIVLSVAALIGYIVFYAFYNH